jgi:hypothetical protein
MPYTRKRSLREIATGARRVRLFDAPGLEDETRRALLMVIYAALFGQAYTLITTGAAWTGFLREVLRADDFTLGLLAAAPVAANTVQILIAHWMQRCQKRRFFLLFFGILGRFFWIPIALAPSLLPGHDARMMLVAACVVASAVGNSFVNLGYASLMADIVPMRIRGRYFASRHAISLVTGLIGALVASFLVDALGRAGYTAALIIAGVAGMADIGCYLWVDFPPMETPGGGRPQGILASLREVLRDAPFMRVVLCFTCWTFAVNLAAPFFNVHMLENLHMRYTQITLTNQIASNVATLLLLARWGKPLDRFGNKAVLQICARACMFLPLLWMLVTPRLVWLIPLINILSGAFWPPIDLAQQNFYLSGASSRNRAMYVAVFFALFNLCGVALGNFTGGFLLQSVFEPMRANLPWMQGLGWTKYHLIFLLSCLLRVAVVFGLFPSLREAEATPYRAALRTMCGEWYRGRVRSAMMLRATLLRRRYRRRHPLAPPADDQDGPGDADPRP